MVFPSNVDLEIKNSQRVAGESGRSAILLLSVLGSVFLFFILRFVLAEMFGLATELVLLLQIVITLSVFVLIFRFAIFKETEKKIENNDAQGDKLTRYLHIRPGSEMYFDLGEHTLTTLDFDTGTSFFVLRLRFGENDAKKAAATRNLLLRLYTICGQLRLERRTFITPEDFEDSDEYRNYIASVNAMPNKEISRHLMRLALASFEYSKEHSNVNCLNIFVVTSGPSQNLKLKSAAEQMVAALQERTAIRSFSFLDTDSLYKVCEDFYGVATIDLELMGARDDSTATESVDTVVSLVRVVSTDGRVFNTENNLVSRYFSKV